MVNWQCTYILAEYNSAWRPFHPHRVATMTTSQELTLKTNLAQAQEHHQGRENFPQHKATLKKKKKQRKMRGRGGTKFGSQPPLALQQLPNYPHSLTNYSMGITLLPC